MAKYLARKDSKSTAYHCGATSANSNLSAESFSLHFRNVFSPNQAPPLPLTPVPEVEYYETRPIITISEVNAPRCRLKLRKSPRPDSLENEVIRQLPSIAIMWITAISNAIISVEHFLPI